MSNKEFSQEFLKNIILSKRKELGYSQQELSDLTGINRAMISKLEQGEYLPSIPQLLSLSNVLDFEINSLFVSTDAES
ncbi:helix-turn-helix transcriptional regulator, partial [Streptococcus suis]|uniref:helix-turn-helix transcriptional regulator n=1 Tax=Streptococcus suis TaxID=1307 RepID=UPI00129053BE